MVIGKIRKEMRKHITTAITAAFAFIMALVWRDAIKETVDKIVARAGIPESAYFYSIIIALIVTVVCVLGIMVVSRYGAKK